MYYLIRNYNRKYFLLCSAYFLIAMIVVFNLPWFFSLLGVMALFGVFLWVEGKMSKKLVRDIEIEVRITSKV